MNSIVSSFGAAMRLSVVSAFILSAGIGTASAATTCADVINVWPGTIANSAVCNSGDFGDFISCLFAEFTQGSIEGECCPTSPSADNSACIQSACTPTRTNNLAAADVTCYEP